MGGEGLEAACRITAATFGNGTLAASSSAAHEWRRSCGATFFAPGGSSFAASPAARSAAEHSADSTLSVVVGSCVFDQEVAMPWVQIQKSTEAKWEDYERVQQAVGDDAPAGLIYHAAGDAEGGRWQSVSIWESEDDFNRFRDERLMPAVERSLPAELTQGGPPPTEWFEAKHVMNP